MTVRDARPRAEGKDKSATRRNPFPDEPFYCLPIKLHDCGLARELTASQFKRYSTILRLANYHKGTEFQATSRPCRVPESEIARLLADGHIPARPERAQ